MEYDAAGRVISLTNENGSHSDFSYDALDRLVQQGGFDGRTQRYHYDLTGKLTQSEDEGLITLWQYDASDRITHRTVNGDPAEQWQYDEHGWLTTISHTSEGHRVAVHYGYDDKGRLTGERQTVENPETGELLWQHETTHAYNGTGAGKPRHAGQPAAGGVADLRQRLPGGHEAGRDAAGRVYAGQAAPGDGAQLRQQGRQ